MDKIERIGIIPQNYIKVRDRLASGSLGTSFVLQTQFVLNGLIPIFDITQIIIALYYAAGTSVGLEIKPVFTDKLNLKEFEMGFATISSSIATITPQSFQTNQTGLFLSIIEIPNPCAYYMKIYAKAITNAAPQVGIHVGSGRGNQWMMG